MKPETLPPNFSRAFARESVFDLFWTFAAERQKIFFKRVAGHPAPWTDDPVLREYRFTNVYRVTDRVSQYLIREVIYKGQQRADEVLFRMLLFKLFNKIDTWELLSSALGELSYRKYKRHHYLDVLNRSVSEKQPIYSSAYIMAPPSGPFKGMKKHEAHLYLIEQMMSEKLPARLEKAGSLQQAYELFACYPMIGEFLGFQLAIDLNYSELVDFSEMEFVVAGPGAKSGIVKCFGELTGMNYERVIWEVTASQDREFKERGITFPGLWGRPLQLIDVQNLFCEIDKYSRVAMPSARGRGARSRIKRKFNPSGRLAPIMLPRKWGIEPSALPAERGVAQASNSTPDLTIRMDLDALQEQQFKHDTLCHRDILALPVQDKLKHFVLHFAKYVGALTAARSKSGPDSGESHRAIVDAFIITLAAANALGMRLRERLGSHFKLAPYLSDMGLTQKSDLLPGIAVVTGKMAKACEAMDHLERLDFRGELEQGIAQMAFLLLSHDGLDLKSATLDRWREVEVRNKK